MSRMDRPDGRPLSQALGWFACVLTNHVWQTAIKRSAGRTYLYGVCQRCGATEED